MQELAEAISENSPVVHPDAFRKAAKEWASAAIETYSGELLEKAMAVSVAMANFLNELEQK